MPGNLDLIAFAALQRGGDIPDDRLRRGIEPCAARLEAHHPAADGDVDIMLASARRGRIGGGNCGRSGLCSERGRWGGTCGGRGRNLWRRRRRHRLSRCSLAGSRFGRQGIAGRRRDRRRHALIALREHRAVCGRCKTGLKGRAMPHWPVQDERQHGRPGRADRYLQPVTHGADSVPADLLARNARKFGRDHQSPSRDRSDLRRLPWPPQSAPASASRATSRQPRSRRQKPPGNATWSASA